MDAAVLNGEKVLLARDILSINNLALLNDVKRRLSGIFFQPFVGKDYASGGIFGKRIMILGESHYCDEGCADCGDCRLHRECMGFTQHVLGDYLDEGTERQNWMRTFLKFERSLVGEETDQAMRLKIWNSVVFFNYL